MTKPILVYFLEKRMLLIGVSLATCQIPSCKISDNLIKIVDISMIIEKRENLTLKVKRLLLIF